ncbi:hypothetical protein [Halorientalis pallida]|nr:hypothetical protein [Halorientalis pallida]
MAPVDPVLFVPSQPGGPELLLPVITLAFGLLIGYLFGRTDWLPGTEP